VKAKAIILSTLLVIGTSPGIPAEEKGKGDADYPDLVTVDDESELMDEFALLQEEEIIFSAAKHQQQISESPSTITVITRQQIENTHCVEITCLLRQVPELEIRRVMPMHHSVGARALASEQGDRVMVLIDGREESTDAFGTVFWMLLPLHLADVERIEIIRGPGSSLYGANAHSVVVSITSRAISSSSTEVFLGGGEHGRDSLHLRLDQVFGDWRLRVNGGLDQADHWRKQDVSERQNYRAGLRLERQWEGSVSSLDLNLVTIDGNIYSLLGPVRLKDGAAFYGMLSHKSDFIRAHVWFSLHDAPASFDLPLNYGDLELGYMPESINILYTTLDSDVQVNWSPFENNLLIAGVNHRWLSMDLEGNDPSLVHQHRLGFFFQDEHRIFGQLTLTGGVRFDYNSITPETFSPRLAAVWRFTPAQVLRLAFGRAFRKPSFFNTSLHLTTVRGTPAFPDLGEFFHRSVGNEDLGNESITSFEIGYRGRFLDGSLTVEADAFFNLYRDTIYFGFDMYYDEFSLPDLANSVFRFENEGMEVNSVGGSVSIIYRIKEILRLSLNYTGRFSYYLSEAGSGLRGKGDRVYWEPAHLLNASVTHINPRGLRVGAAVHARSAFEEAWAEDGGLFSDNVMVPNPACVFISAFASWRLMSDSYWFEAGVRAYNLLGAGFRDLTVIRRFDGLDLGGQLLGRRIFIFLRAGL